MYFGPCSTKNKETPQQKNAVDTVVGNESRSVIIIVVIFEENSFNNANLCSHFLKTALGAEIHIIHLSLTAHAVKVHRGAKQRVAISHCCLVAPLT
jgi:hypothetical protein